MIVYSLRTYSFVCFCLRFFVYFSSFSLLLFFAFFFGIFINAIFVFSILPRYQTDEIKLSTHTGTHLDAPVHFHKTGYSVADIPLANLIEKQLIIIDITEHSQSRQDYSVTVDDIVEFEKLHGEIPEDSVVAFLTGWSRHWPNKLAYFGTEGTDAEQTHFPGISASAARFLATNRRVVGVGIDGPSIDCGQCGMKWGFPAHVQLASANIYILENLDVSLFRLPSVGSTITVLPMKLVSASGSPVRAIAQYTHHHHDTNSSTILLPVWTFLTILFASLFKL